MTTAPALNHTFSAALLPPLPSSSGSKHRRVLLSNPSSAPKQYLDSSFGRSQAIATQTEYAFGRAESSLGTPDSAPTQSQLVYGKPDPDPESVLSRAYLPRRSVMAWPTSAADESASLQGSYLFPELQTSHSRTASAPIIKSDSGDNMQWACGLLWGPVCVADPYYRPDGTAFDLLLKLGTIVCTL